MEHDRTPVPGFSWEYVCGLTRRLGNVVVEGLVLSGDGVHMFGATAPTPLSHLESGYELNRHILERQRAAWHM